MTEQKKLDRIPIEAAAALGKKYNLDRVLLISTSRDNDKTYTVSWGKTKEDCGFAAMDIQKLRAVIEGQPTSYEQAIQIAKKIRPDDVEGIRTQDRIKELEGELDQSNDAILQARMALGVYDEPFLDMAITKLINRIEQLKEACDTFEKNSQEASEVFEVLVRHNLIPDQKPGPKMSEIIEAVISGI